MLDQKMLEIAKQKKRSVSFKNRPEYHFEERINMREMDKLVDDKIVEIR